MAASVWVVVNPTSQRGRSRRLISNLEEGLRSRGFEFELHRTEGVGHAVELAGGAVQAGVGHLLVVGGDGTIHEVANGLLASAAEALPSLAVLPVGTGNDFHRMVGADGTVEGTLDLLDRGFCAEFDVGVASWPGGSRYFVNLAGMGLDVAILQRRRVFSRLPGKSQYLAALASGLLGFRAVPVRVEIQGAEALEREAFIAAVTVGRSVAGGIPLSPDASPFDGLLDFCLVERMNMGRLLYSIPWVLYGTHRGLPLIHLQQVKAVRVTSPHGQPYAFELDGEVVGGEVESLELRPADVRLPVLVSEEVSRTWQRIFAGGSPPREDGAAGRGEG